MQPASGTLSAPVALVISIKIRQKANRPFLLHFLWPLRLRRLSG